MPRPAISASTSGRSLLTRNWMKVASWSRQAKVHAQANTTIRPFFQPSLLIRNPMITRYIGIHISLLEKACQIKSVTGQCSELIAAVKS